MAPRTAPQSQAQGLSTIDTTDEIFAGSSSYPVSTFPAGSYGTGVRVPMVVISPWSKGGWVNSEVFDHTSLIRFIESRFGAQYPGIVENNITPCRRAVSGALRSALNFTSPNDSKVQLPSTIAYVPPDDLRHPDYKPTPPGHPGNACAGARHPPCARSALRIACEQSNQPYGRRRNHLLR